MTNSTHYRSGELLTLLSVLLVLSPPILLFWQVSSFWKPVVVIIGCFITWGILIYAIIHQWRLKKQSILTIRGTLAFRRVQVWRLVAATCMGIAGVIWFQKAWQSSPPDLWLLAQASINFTAFLGGAGSLLPLMQRKFVTNEAFGEFIFYQKVRWKQIDGYDWEEKEVKGQKYLSLILYFRNKWKIPFFEQLKIRMMVQPEEKNGVDNVLHKYIA